MPDFANRSIPGREVYKTRAWDSGMETNIRLDSPQTGTVLLPAMERDTPIHFLREPTTIASPNPHVTHWRPPYGSIQLLHHQVAAVGLLHAVWAPSNQPTPRRHGLRNRRVHLQGPCKTQSSSKRPSHSCFAA